MTKRPPLSSDEREEISRWRAGGRSMRSIAKQLDRDPSTIRKFLARLAIGDRVDARLALSTVAKAIAQEQANAKELCPPSITAKPFTEGWWAQNERSFAAGFIRQGGVPTPESGRLAAGRGLGPLSTSPRRRAGSTPAPGGSGGRGEG